MTSLFLRSVCLILPGLVTGPAADDLPEKPPVSAESLENLRKALHETALAAGSDPSVDDRSVILAKLAEGLARLGDRKQALTLASKASELARLGKPESHCLRLVKTARTHEFLGDLSARRRDIEEAIKIATDAAPGQSRFATQILLIPELEALGDHARAVDIVDRMSQELADRKDNSSRERNLRSIVNARVALHDLVGALNFIDDTAGQDEKLKAKLLNNLVVETASSESIGSLRKTKIGTPQERDQRCKFLNELALRIDLGKSQNALIFGSLAASLASLGDYDNAEKIVEKMAEIPSPEPGTPSDQELLERPWALIMIAQTRAEAGEKEPVRNDCRRAMKMVMDDPKLSDSQRDSIRTGVAVVYAAIGDFTDSIKILELEKANYPRSKILTKIAALQEKSGNGVSARLTYTRAIGWSESEQKVLPAAMIDNLLMERAEIITRLGGYDRAKAVMAEIKSPMVKRSTEGFIAVRQARNGDLAGALATALPIENLYSRTITLGRIVDEVAPGDR